MIKTETVFVNINGYFEFLLANLQNQLTSVEQVGMLFKPFQLQYCHDWVSYQNCVQLLFMKTIHCYIILNTEQIYVLFLSLYSFLIIKI